MATFSVRGESGYGLIADFRRNGHPLRSQLSDKLENQIMRHRDTTALYTGNCSRCFELNGRSGVEQT